MGRTRVGLAAVAALVLASGCASYYGAGRAADLPNPKPYTPPHAPDASITSRETDTRLEKRANIFSMKVLPPVDWALLGVALAF